MTPRTDVVVTNPPTTTCTSSANVYQTGVDNAVSSSRGITGAITSPSTRKHTMYDQEAFGLRVNGKFNPAVDLFRDLKLRRPTPAVVNGSCLENCHISNSNSTEECDEDDTSNDSAASEGRAEVSEESQNDEDDAAEEKNIALPKGHGTSTQSTLVSPLEVQSGVKKYKCPQCPGLVFHMFDGPNSVKEHFKDYHND